MFHTPAHKVAPELPQAGQIINPDPRPYRLADVPGVHFGVSPFAHRGQLRVGDRVERIDLIHGHVRIFGTVDAVLAVRGHVPPSVVVRYDSGFRQASFESVLRKVA